jgi:uridylate kinase
MAYKRVLLKLSGEALKRDENGIIDTEYVKSVANMIKTLHDQNIQIAIVIGAGNIWRGAISNEIGIDHAKADYMGMMGTVINAGIVSEMLNNLGVDNVVFSAISAPCEIATMYDKNAALKALEDNKVIFLAGGTGKPFFTTDTASTLRAIELNIDAILMGKNGVEGVYDSDPRKNKDAKFIKNITFDEIIQNKLQVMDITAVQLLLDKNIEIRVFSMSSLDNFLKVANGEDIGTTCKRG